MKKSIVLTLATCMLTASLLSAGSKVVSSPQSMVDWHGYRKTVTCENGLFDTNRGLFVLFTKKNIPITPGKSYVLKGDFKLKPYAPFGNILFGLMFFNDKDQELPKRAYIGASPYDDRVCPGNEAHVRDFWLTFSGRLPEGKFVIPKGATYMKILLHQRTDHPVDMIFKNITLCEED